MSSLFMLRTGLFTAEVFAGSVLIVCLAWCAARRGRASERHLVWASGFGALAALPLLVAALPSLLHIRFHEAQPLPVQTVVPVGSYREAMLPAATLPAPSPFSFDGESVLRALFFLWLAGAIVVALRFAVSAFCLLLLERRSRTFALLPEDEPKIAAAGRECELRLSDREIGPATWGISRAVILLPNSALRWSRERMGAVLLHELAHVRRRDSAVQALAHAVCALYWPNPLVWWAAARLRREAEMAADDAAVAEGMRPSSYAGELLSLAQDFATAHANGVAFSMAAPSALKARVKSILSYEPARTVVTTHQAARVVAVALCVAGAIAFACPTVAQSPDASPKPAQRVPVQSVRAQEPNSVDADQAANADDVVTTEQAAPTDPRQEQVERAAPADEAVAADQVVSAAPGQEPVKLSPAPQASPATPANPAIDTDTNVEDGDVHVIVDGRHWNALSPEEKQHARAAIAKARRELATVELQSARINAEMERIGPQLQKAMAEVKIHHAEIERAMVDVQPQIDQALAQIHAAGIDKAIAKARIQEQIAKAMEALKRAKIKINITQDETTNPDTKVAPDPSDDESH